MNQKLLLCLYIAGLYAPYLAGSRNTHLQARPQVKGPSATHALFAAIAIPTALQFVFPSLLTWFARDAERFLHGEWWRLFTPLFFQDAGIGGALFNLVSLLLIGRVAEKLWGGARVALIFFGGGIAAEGVGMLWQPSGAGNSVGNFSLAASIAIACLVHRSNGTVRTLAIAALAADAILLALHDIHGAAAAVGCVIASLLLFRANRGVAA